jgi:hypothetical protein
LKKIRFRTEITAFAGASAALLVGLRAGTPSVATDPGGRPISDEEWRLRQRDWLPSAEDHALVARLMRRGIKSGRSRAGSPRPKSASTRTLRLRVRALAVEGGRAAIPAANAAEILIRRIRIRSPGLNPAHRDQQAYPTRDEGQPYYPPPAYPGPAYSAPPYTTSICCSESVTKPD